MDLPVIPVYCLLGREQWARLCPDLTDGNLIFDTGGSWYHSSGLSGKGTITTHDFQANGRRWGYSVCTFSFTSLNLGAGVNISVQGENSLCFDVDGNVSLATSIHLDGQSGKQGIYSGKGGPGGWSSGRGLRNTDLFSNLHPALDGQGPGGGRGYEIGKSTGGGSYGGSGSGGLNGGVAGTVYGDESISDLVGGSGGGHTIIASGDAGGGGGALGFVVGGSFTLEANASLSANGGTGRSHPDGSGAGGSGGAISIEAASILNSGSIEARGGDAIGSASRPEPEEEAGLPF